MIKAIEIENIKGIKFQRFELNIVHNKPSILVAPNGFGKSSIATAFNSINANRIDLDEDDYYFENSANLPKIQVEYERVDGTIAILNADNSHNTISNEIDCFVINNQIIPRGIGSRFGRATASLEIKDVILVDRIPKKTLFNYSYRIMKTKFGCCCRVLPNLDSVLNNFLLVEQLSENYTALKRGNGDRIQGKIDAIIENINAQKGTSQELHDWVVANSLVDLKQIEYLKTIGDLINTYDIGYNSEVNSYLAAIQLIWLYNDNPSNFKAACTYHKYLFELRSFNNTLLSFNCTWKHIRSSEKGGKLVVKFPKAIHISNGQRDILTFISMLFKAKRNLRKDENILIIDEVFDYLDDANLIAAQYYITTFIKEYEDLGKRIYPLILTHLNPSYFKNFVFSNQMIYYLNRSTIQVDMHIVRLLRNRKNAVICADIDKFLLHYDPGAINKRSEFKKFTLPETWGEGNNFNLFINNEVVKYLADEPYDPFAVCGALRVKIEEIAYKKLKSVEAQTAFLITHKTRCKLEKAQEMGVVSPESHYLLGIIYNEGMHWKDNCDNISPIASKLENLTIKKLIRDVFI